MVKGLDDLAPEGLLDRARKAAGLVDAAARVRIFCHYDPDGTTSASILARALMRRGKRIHATMAHALDRTSAARLREESNELLVVSDMGSGQLDLLEGLPYPVVVLDRGLAFRALPLGKALALSIEPDFRGLSGRPDAAADFLRAVSLDPEASVRDLDAGGRRKLTSILAARLMEQRAAPEALEVLVADRYWIEPDQMHAHDLEAYVNSCDRLGREGLGMAVCLGDREALSRAEKLLDEYTSKVLGYLVSLESKGLFPKKHVQFFYCDDASLAGVVAGTGMLFFFDPTRPTLGLSVLEGITKVSARGTRAHIAAGVDLAVALREAASQVSGNGGGHNIASGATIPKGKEDRFLARVDEIVGRQLEGPPATGQ